MAFLVVQAPALLCHYETHAKFFLSASTLVDAAKPGKFTIQIKWDDRIPTFLIYLRAIPGRDKVPLKYNYRENNIPNLAPNAHFLDNYINMAPLTGEAYAIDSAHVHTFIVIFVSGNETAKAKIQYFAAQNDGRVDYQALVDHYEGVGVHAIEITKAEATLKGLFYRGEKNLTCGGKSLKKIISAFVAYDKHEKRQVHSIKMKLRILLDKVNAEFLAHTKAGIRIKLTRIPMTMSYIQDLSGFRNEVNLKFPP